MAELRSFISSRILRYYNKKYIYLKYKKSCNIIFYQIENIHHSTIGANIEGSEMTEHR